MPARTPVAASVDWSADFRPTKGRANPVFGLERLSVPEVAERAGLNKTSVYRRWPTKQHLVKAALQQSMEATTRPPETGALGSDLASLASSLAEFITPPTGLGIVRTVMVDGESAEAKALNATMWRGPARGLPAPRSSRPSAGASRSPTPTSSCCCSPSPAPSCTASSSNGCGSTTRG
ncbi:MAG: helix-turn-helix transcriptional regulator [Myxococcus sp.]|nr:helix-turn-helix transcriptional regulator [Myxococcus sp.]